MRDGVPTPLLNAEGELLAPSRKKPAADVLAEARQSAERQPGQA
jgi:hypothetical protein